MARFFKISLYSTSEEDYTGESVIINEDQIVEITEIDSNDVGETIAKITMSNGIEYIVLRDIDTLVHVY